MRVYYMTNDEINNNPNKNGCYIDEDGNKYYYKNNKLHCESCPAVEWSCGSKNWYRNNKLHRVDGPAIEYHDGNKGWFLFDKRYSEGEYNKLVSNIPLFYWKNRDQLWK